MPIKDYKLPRYRELVITLRRKIGLTSIDLVDDDKLAPLPTRLDDETPKRRLKKGFIRFFDLGQILSGETFQTWGDLFAPELVFNESGSFNIAGSVSDGDAETVFEAITTEILAIDAAARAANFYEIKKGDEPFEKTITIETTDLGDLGGEARLSDLPAEVWTSDGLKLTGGQLAALTIKLDGVLYAQETLDFAALKITSSPSFDADAVAFAPVAKMDVYFMPSLVLNSSKTSFANGQVIGADFTDFNYFIELLNYQVQLLPRSLVADYLDLIEDSPGLSSYQEKYRYTQIIKNFPNPRLARDVANLIAPSPTHYEYTTDASADPGDYPFADIYTPTSSPTNTSTKFNQSFQVNFAFFTTDLMRLRAIVFASGSWFYVWKP